MRYRAIGKHGTIVSALSVGLAEDGARRSASDWTHLIFAALESGINCFEILTLSPAIVQGVAEALNAIERQLIFVSCRIGRAPADQPPLRDFSSAVLSGQLRALLARTGLGYLDLAMLDAPKAGEADEGLPALTQAREAGALRMIGAYGDDEAVDEHITCGAFDVLGTPFNLTSGWRERNWLRTAGRHDVAVIGYEPYPEAFHKAMTAAAAARSKQGGRAEALEGAGSYDFLDRTRGWSADEICIAYALTEPALATVQIAAAAPDRLEELARTAEREMPPGLAAQIEMARFAPQADAQEARRA